MKSRIASYLVLTLAAAQVLVILASWLLTAAMPDAFFHSLLSAEGIRWFFGQFESHLASPLLVWLLLASVTYGAVRNSGIIQFDRAEYRHRIALRFALLELLVFVAVILALTMVPHAILLNVMGGLFPSSFSKSIFPYTCFALIVMSLSYGILSNRLKTPVRCLDALTSGIRSFAPLFLLYIFVVQLYYSLLYILW